jgi:ribosomal protein S18
MLQDRASLMAREIVARHVTGITTTSQRHSDMPVRRAKSALRLGAE